MLIVALCSGAALYLFLRQYLFLSWAKANAEPPSPGALLQEPPELEVSSIVAPVMIPLSEIERIVDEKIPEVLVEARNKLIKGRIAADFKVVRRGRLELKEERGLLVASMPVQVAARIFWRWREERRSRRGKEATQSAQAIAEIKMRVEIKPSISKDWKAKTTSKVSYQWASAPVLYIGPFQFNIQQIADRELTERLPKISAEIDACIERKDPLRARVVAIWNELHAPIQLTDSPSSWWVSEMLSASATEPIIKDKFLQVTVGLTGRFRVVFSEDRPKVEKNPLPPRTRLPQKKGFTLMLSMALGWGPLNEKANEQLKGQSWQIPGGGMLYARSIELYPSGDKIVAGLHYTTDLSGRDTEGVLYFTGRPVIDRNTRTLRIIDFDYLLQSEDDFLVRINSLIDGTLKSTLQQKLALSLGERIDNIQEKVNLGIDKHRQKLKGDLSSVSLRNVRLTETSVVIDGVATGKIMLHPKQLTKPGQKLFKTKPIQIPQGQASKL